MSSTESNAPQAVSHDEGGAGASAPAKASTPIRARLEEQVANILTACISLKKWRFYFNDNEVEAEKVAGPSGVLPAVLWHAEKLHQTVYGSSLGVQFVVDQQSMLGVQAQLPRAAGTPRSPIALFCLESLVQAQENHLVHDGASIDHLIQGFFEDFERGLLPIVGQSTSQSLEVQAGAPAALSSGRSQASSAADGVPI